MAQPAAPSVGGVAGTPGSIPGDNPPDLPTQQPAPAGARGPERNTTVSFDWTESIPGAGACKAAKFTGRFYCEVPLVSGETESLNGSLSLVLQGSTESQSLTIAGGGISVYDVNMNRLLIASVSGGLNCTTQRLEAVVDPTPSAPMPVDRQFSWFNPVVQPTTTGMLDGSLDPDLQEVNGTLELLFEPNARCSGRFGVKAGAADP